MMIVSPNRSQSNWKVEATVKIGDLRPIARRQINSLLRRLTKTGNYQLYQEEIDKIISYEQKKRPDIQSGGEID